MKIGLDIGSTTIKCVLIDDSLKIIYKTYERHCSQITQKLSAILSRIKSNFYIPEDIPIAISGSAGIGVSEFCGAEFVQEVYAEKIAINKLLPETDVAIELGGEDAKILFLSGTVDVRMNGSCAGGTGAFIDQMTTLLNISPEELNKTASESSHIYPIASRCGVFAKSDIQPLLNQGAKKEDVCASILEAVKNQTISGLSQGRKIQGNIVYLGGPLTFFPQLRKAFDRSLNTVGICPKDSLYYVSIGAALCCDNPISIDTIIEKCKKYGETKNFIHLPPLFSGQNDYEQFKKRHSLNYVESVNSKNYRGDAFIGIDAGSTTLKAVAISREFKILHSEYRVNSGDPIKGMRSFLLSLYKKHPNINIVSSAVTGYGESIIKNAFNIDFGIVETVAHFISAKRFMPDVEFIIDIGGQDIKCFKIRNGVIDNIFLNEACSSGCGSFLQSFANALGYSISDFSKLALFAKKPADLGSRCTVFMNSSVKQAQKDGADISDISAGLAMSVVKNAIYKVIRCNSSEELGKKIVVQGGTFLNDAVLRAFETELNTEVVRPNIAGLMGAYGAALYAMESKPSGKSGILDRASAENFSYKSSKTLCGLCTNRCSLSVNVFNNHKKYITGNRCERPLIKKNLNSELNIYEYKLNLLSEYSYSEGKNGTIGIPMVLNMFEMLPFWHKFFEKLGFGITTSGFSLKDTYNIGQETIPSDTVCFPAKLVHGHIQNLINKKCKIIFYPCMSYNFNEKQGSNNYNCPVVAYYPEVIGSNIKIPKDITYINDYIGIHKKRFFPFKMQKILKKYLGYIPLLKIVRASASAYREYELYLSKVRAKAKQIINTASNQNMDIIVLAGRPYHVDPEINHGIDKLILGLGAAVISEDSLNLNSAKTSTDVLNQWTYHARLYNAANFAASRKDVNLVQLISFGCGIDAITSDEVRRILENNNKIYTQIKIDEIINPGAVKIRLRSLFSAVGKLRRDI